MKKLFQNDRFACGVNYWASHAATEMWRKWDADVVNRDFQVISKQRIKYVRVFPLWKDFQPIVATKDCGSAGGTNMELRFGEDEEFPPDTPAGRVFVDETMMERFEELADIAEKHGLKLIVAIMTIHMTGRLFVPRAMENLDIFTDWFALTWRFKAYEYFVERMKGHPAIAAWGPENEPICSGPFQSDEHGWVWSKLFYDAIRRADNSRPITAGNVPGLMDTQSEWILADQAELADVMAVHRYDLHNSVSADGFNAMRNVMAVASQNKITSDIAGKASFVQETGGWRATTVSRRLMGDASRNIAWNLWTEGAEALMWWCAFDQEKMTCAPYNWGTWPGLEHGIFSSSGEPHPVARAFKRFVDFTETLPFDNLPAPETDAVCIISDYETGMASQVLARQAGLNFKYHFAQDRLPDADAYFFPSVQVRGSISNANWLKLLENVRNGAVLYISMEDCNQAQQYDYCGMEVQNRRSASGNTDIRCGDFSFSVPVTNEKTLQVISAEVLAENSNGTPVFLKNRFGKGTVYTFMHPLEAIAFETPGFYESDAFRIYQSVLESRNRIKVANKNVIVREHQLSETQRAITFVNCSMDVVDESVSLPDGWDVSGNYSDCENNSLKSGTLHLEPNSGLLITVPLGQL